VREIFNDLFGAALVDRGAIPQLCGHVAGAARLPIQVERLALVRVCAAAQNTRKPLLALLVGGELDGQGPGVKDQFIERLYGRGRYLARCLGRAASQNVLDLRSNLVEIHQNTPIPSAGDSSRGAQSAMKFSTWIKLARGMALRLVISPPTSEPMWR